MSGQWIKLEAELAKNFSGLVYLFQFDPFVGGVGLGDVAGAENDDGNSGGIEGRSVGSEGDADRFAEGSVTLGDFAQLRGKGAISC